VVLVEVDRQLARAAFVRDDFSLCSRRFAAVLTHLGRTAPAVRGDAYLGLSLCESRLGHGSQALAHARQAHTLDVAALGLHHPLTLETNMALESAMVVLGRYDEAEAVLRELVDELGHRYGPDHPITLTAVHDLGYALTCAGKAAAGEPWLRRAAVERARTLGRHHPWYAMSETVLGMALVAQRRFDPAAQALARARGALGTHAAASPFVYATLLENEADLALAQGHGPQARARFTAALAAARNVYSSGTERLAMLRLGQGLALLQVGDAAAGRPMLRQALADIGDHPDCRAGQIAQARRLLGN
jgi:serine/threonine-protein kinase